MRADQSDQPGVRAAGVAMPRKLEQRVAERTTSI
jgi:hypothetical protein